MTTVALSSQSSSRIATRSIFAASLTGGAAAAVANLALYGAGRLQGVDFIARFDPNHGLQALPPALVGVGSLMPSLIAALVMVGLTRLIHRPVAPFAAIAATFVLLSLVGPLKLADASIATKVMMSAMHFIAGIAISW